MSNAAKTFNVSISGDVILTVAEIWPDGDAPENPTAEDVAEVMREYGRRPSRLIAELDLPCEVSVDGTVVMVEG